MMMSVMRYVEEELEHCDRLRRVGDQVECTAR